MIAKEELEKVNGLVFRRPKAVDYGVLSHKACWGNLLEAHQFTTPDEMQARMDATLDTVIKTDVAFLDPATATWQNAEGWKGVASVKENKLYSFVSDQYIPTQDYEVFAPLVKIARENQLQTMGRIDGQGTGKVRANVLFNNSEAVINILEDYHYPVMIGFRSFNSHRADSSFGAEVFGIDVVCSNYNLWGKIMGKWTHSHMVSFDVISNEYVKMLEHIIDNSEVLRNKAHEARTRPLIIGECEDLAWHLTIPVGGIRQMVNNLEDYAPHIKTLGLNALTFYNATTCYITYRGGGGSFIDRTEDLANRAQDILCGDLDAMIDHGHKLKVEYFEAQERAAKKKAEIILAAGQSKIVGV